MTKEFYDLYIKEKWFICLSSSEASTIANFTKCCKIPNQEVSIQIENLCSGVELDGLCQFIWENQKYGPAETLSLSMYYFACEFDVRDCYEVCLCNTWTSE